ncbi:MAG: biopolymer transporter ExbD [Phycisphaeraceae bacterium]|nr:biopolymer transporter ExbD [Phycisphaeraceae bacterium]
MRIVPRHHQSDRRMALSLSSMIDVVFLLLAYFLITTVVTQREDRLTPNLQLERDASGGETQDFEPQEVEVLVIDSSVVFRIGGRDFTERAALIAALEELPKDPGLFIRVTDGPSVGDAAMAIQCGRDAGFEEVTYVPAAD